MVARSLFQVLGNQMVHVPKQYIVRSNPDRRSHSYKPIKAHNAMPEAQSAQSLYWASLNADVEAYLKKAIPIRQPITVFEPMYHLVLHAPPSTAPGLCVAACEVVGGSQDQAMAAAAAVRLMHAAAWAHDDLLSAQRPKSRPTGNRALSPNIKLLIGDGIVPFGFELLARVQGSNPGDLSGPNKNNSGQILRVMVEITRAMGSQGMVDGRYKEFLCTHSGVKKSERLERAWEKREGELHACAGACGAILGGGSEEEIEKMRRFGQFVGMIQGMVNWGVNVEDEMVNKMRELAMNELKGFNEEKIGTLSKLVDFDFCNV